jgi:hypothetical protein
MSRFAPALVIAAALAAAGCNKTPAPDQTALNPPSDGNLAQVANTSQPAPAAQQSAPTQRTQYQYPPPQPPQANPPDDQQAQAYPPDDQAAYDDYYPDDSYDNQQPVYASQPPPPLPDYSQPPCPGENYIWTPGNWAYANAGYYWVPGVWVMAPYIDALWTPPFWDFYSGRYRWHRGYWGHHIGFYGGIYYGHGYTGRGYYGGYWNNGRFAYNRAVTNVNINIVHNVYESKVTNINVTRVSYNGGPGGVRIRPIPAELAVLRETRTAPVPAQIQHLRSAESNRAQFMAVNRGRPAIIAQAQPLQTNYRAPAPRPEANRELRVLPPVAARPNPALRPAQPGAVPNRSDEFRRPQGQPVPNQPVPNQQGREFGRPPAPAQPGRPEFARPGAPAQTPQGREFGRPPEQARPQFQPRQQAPRPEPARPAPAPPPVQQARPDLARPEAPAQAPRNRDFGRAPEQGRPQPPPQARPEPPRSFQRQEPQARPAPEPPRQAPPPPAARAPQPPAQAPAARPPAPPRANPQPQAQPPQGQAPRAAPRDRNDDFHR